MKSEQKIGRWHLKAENTLVDSIFLLFGIIMFAIGIVTLFGWVVSHNPPNMFYGLGWTFFGGLMIMLSKKGN